MAKEEHAPHSKPSAPSKRLEAISDRSLGMLKEMLSRDDEDAVALVAFMNLAARQRVDADVQTS